MASENAERLEGWVARARKGDRAALERLVAAIEGDVYGLALRFLWHPQDAEDASQDILVRIVTHLGTFRAESSFRTWVYRVACNTLKTLGKRRMERREVSFEEFGEDLARGLDLPAPELPEAERALLLEEVKIGCTTAMLLCLERPQRLAFILGEILELDHREAAEALEITPAAFRQRLSRARRALERFLLGHCGLVRPGNACRCAKRLAPAIAAGRVDPEQPNFATSRRRAEAFPAVLREIRGLEEKRRMIALYRSHPDPEPQRDLAAFVRRLVVDDDGTRSGGRPS